MAHPRTRCCCKRDVLTFRGCCESYARDMQWLRWNTEGPRFQDCARHHKRQHEESSVHGELQKLVQLATSLQSHSLNRSSPVRIGVIKSHNCRKHFSSRSALCIERQYQWYHGTEGSRGFPMYLGVGKPRYIEALVEAMSKNKKLRIEFRPSFAVCPLLNDCELPWFTCQVTWCTGVGFEHEAASLTFNKHTLC